MPQPTEKGYTTEDIYNLPDGQRAELINGELFMMSPPRARHQRIAVRLTQAIANYIDAHNEKCEVYPAPFAVFLFDDNKTYVEPDISVICDPERVDEYGCNGAPDWIIEIVSPSSERMDYMLKLFQYRAAGVREYWIADPDKNLILVYDFEHDQMETYRFGQLIPSGIFSGLEIAIDL